MSVNQGGDVAEAFDAYKALGWLARQNFGDPDRVALLGFSMGGFATLDSVETGPGAIEKIEKRHFRAAIAYYPGRRDRASVMTVPTLILVGDKDDWTLASWCRDMMARRNGRGAAVKLVVYPGATHGRQSASFRRGGAESLNRSQSLRIRPVARQPRTRLRAKSAHSGPAEPLPRGAGEGAERSQRTR